ncbi:nucleolar gtp-binding protein 2 [Nannochloropsis oceanica]
MGKSKGSALSSSKSSDNPNRKASDVKYKGGNLRDRATINRLQMYRGGKPIRNKKGKIVGGVLMMRNKVGGQAITGATGRTQPDRRWFGNTRVISQVDLDRFREEMTTRAADPFSVILRRKKIPMGLLVDTEKVQRMNLLQTETYQATFGAKSTRKRPKLSAGVMEAAMGGVAGGSGVGGDYASLLERVNVDQAKYQAPGHTDGALVEEAEFRVERRHDLFDKGQSRRIWGELYKVIDCSDVVIQVLDARNIPGTRCDHLEKHLKKNASHKHLILIVNKCDLVPAWVVRRWVKILSASYPTLAFHASITNSFGKGSLINLLRQYAKLHQDKKQISVGVVGYPNVGKSSIINTLKSKKVCKVAPIPGETKVWQYITLMKRIYLIDCPGIVYDTGDDETAIVLKGVVRAERLPDPTEFIAPILELVKPEYMVRTYGIKEWKDALDFMTKVAKRTGKLVKGGEPDLNNVAVSIINDFQRGKLPHFVAPPPKEGEEEGDEAGEEDWIEGGLVELAADAAEKEEEEDDGDGNEEENEEEEEAEDEEEEEEEEEVEEEEEEEDASEDEEEEDKKEEGEEAEKAQVIVEKAAQRSSKRGGSRTAVARAIKKPSAARTTTAKVGSLKKDSTATISTTTTRGKIMNKGNPIAAVKKKAVARQQKMQELQQQQPQLKKKRGLEVAVEAPASWDDL